MNSTHSTIPSDTFAHPYVEYCAVVHRGELLKKKMHDYGISVTEAALKFGYSSRNSMYHQFRKANADIRLFMFLHKTYNIDFSHEIPEFRSEIMQDIMKDPAAEFGVITMGAHLKLMEEVKDQLIAALETIRILQHENNQLLKEKLLGDQKKLPSGK